MKANQQALRNDDDAQVGIGTMIVFIATILVAAVAAGVLINVSGGLQSKAVATGNDATQNVASNIMVQSVFGEDTGTDGTINTATIFVTLGAGSEPIDLEQVVIQYTDGTNLYTAAGLASGTGDLTIAVERGNAGNVLESGELLTISFDPTTPWAESAGVSMDLIPEVGNAASVGFTTPDAFGGKTIIQLF